MENLVSFLKLGGDRELETSDNEFAFDIEDSLVDDTRILLNIISKCIRFLFRVGVLVRRSPPVDKFRRALQRSDPIPAWAYINHVKDKYSKLFPI